MKKVPSTPDGVAQYLAQAGLGCADFIVKTEDPSEVKTTLAPDPSSAMGSCTIEGTRMSVTVFGSKADKEMAAAQLKTIYAAVAKSMGIKELTYVYAGEDDRVWLSVSKESGGDKGVTPAQEELLGRVAKALNGKVVKVDV